MASNSASGSSNPSSPASPCSHSSGTAGTGAIPGVAALLFKMELETQRRAEQRERDAERLVAFFLNVSDDAIRAKEDAAAATLAGHNRHSISTEARDPRFAPRLQHLRTCLRDQPAGRASPTRAAAACCTPDGCAPTPPSSTTLRRPGGCVRRSAGSWDARALADDLAAGLAADRVCDSVDELAWAMQAQLATLAGFPAFPVRSRPDPTFKPHLSGFLATPQGTRRVTVLLDTGATHCFICARLAATLCLPPSTHPGPTSVTTAAPGGTQDLPAPVLAHLGLNDTFREALSVALLDLDVGDDLMLGWDWISSHNLLLFYVDGRLSLRSGPAQLHMDLLPAKARLAPRTLAVIGHGEFRRLFRQI